MNSESRGQHAWCQELCWGSRAGKHAEAVDPLPSVLQPSPNGEVQCTRGPQGQHYSYRVAQDWVQASGWPERKRQMSKDMTRDIQRRGKSW